MVRLLKVIFLLDPLDSLYGPLRPPLLIAKELKGKFDFLLVSPVVNRKVREALEAQDIPFLDLKKRFLSSGSLLTFEAWLRGGRFEPKDENLIVNFSQHFLARSHIYYAQGPITRALEDMRPELRFLYKAIYLIFRPVLVRKDRRFINEIRKETTTFIANSRFCASMYENWGVHVDGVIYPPLDCEKFKPTTSNPSGEYVLTYAGKETKYGVIKDLADVGIKMKVFGSKAPNLPGFLIHHSNIEVLGKVSDEELIDLYSNALFTLFTFTHEPFGYIPIESMACGTPVLTYDRQGPRESVINENTGWLVRSDGELLTIAVKLWKDGYSEEIRRNARKRSLLYDVSKIAVQWQDLLKVHLEKDLRKGY